MPAKSKSVSNKLRKLMHITKEISSCLNESEVLKRSLELETEIVNAETGSILLLDESGEYLYFSVALGNEEAVLKDHRVEVGEGIAGYVAEEQKPILVRDTEDDERFDEYFDSKTGFQTESVLCVPIQCGEDLLGVAEVINKENGPAFTEEDLLMFSAFAGQIAVALENARLHQEVLSRERVKQEVKTARKVQESYLPEDLPDVNGIRFGATLEAAQKVSGDFYDYFQVSEDKTAFLIGDVSGKGMASAMHMCRVLTELRTRLKNVDDPADVMQAVNARLVETSTQGMFVTLVLFVIDKNKDSIEVVNAGHLPFYERSNGSVIVHGDDQNPPIGISPDVTFTSYSLNLSSDTQIISITDGMTEAKNPEGEMFELEGVQRIVENTILPPDLIVEKIDRDVSRFCETAKQRDDMTAIAFGDSELNDHFEFEILSHPSYLKIVRKAVDEILRRGTDDENQISTIKVGICEAVSNIIEHTYHNSQTGHIDVQIRLDGDEFSCGLRDYGPKVNPEKLKGRDLDGDEIEPGGLGLHFMDNIFDEHTYDTSIDEGNKLTLRKDMSNSD